MRLTIAPRDTPRILESGNQMPVRPGAIDNRRCSFMAVMTPGLAQVRFNHLRAPEYLPPLQITPDMPIESAQIAPCCGRSWIDLGVLISNFGKCSLLID